MSMNEETREKIISYRDARLKIKAGDLPAMEEVRLTNRLKRLKGELGAKLVAQIEAGEYDDFRKALKPERCDVLMLTANPIGTTQLNLQGEIEAITKAAGEGSVPFRVLPRFAGVEDLGNWILNTETRVVHFSGHGGVSGTLSMENEDGSEVKVMADAAADLMKKQRWELDAVFLNACWTEQAASPFLELSDWVVGTSEKVDDDEAIKFSKGFYRALANKKSVPEAFDWALGEMKLRNLNGDVYKLIRGNRPLSGDETLIPQMESIQASKETSGVSRSDSPEPPAAKPKEGRDYPVWFGTDRKPNNKEDFTQGFGSERDDRVWYGRAEVTIPKAHKIGGVGSPWWKRIFTGDDRLKVKHEKLESLERAAFWSGVKAQVEEHVAAGTKEPMAMVYVHGYNVSFEEAAIRAAQLGCDLKLPGPMAFYSWPSRGTLAGYLADSNAVQASTPHLVKFLQGFFEELEGSVSKVHVLAHSMGNRLVLDAVRDLNELFGKPVFDQMILAAADVDRMTFIQKAPAYRDIAKRTTLYVSDKDNALMGSEIVNSAERAGYYDPITLIEGIDTVRAAKVSQGLLGHGYYAASRPLLMDIHQLIRWNAGPHDRGTINPFDEDGDIDSWELAG